MAGERIAVPLTSRHLFRPPFSERGRERHKACGSKDSSRSEKSVIINPPETSSQDSPVHNGEPLPGEPSPGADPGEEGQVLSRKVAM